MTIKLDVVANVAVALCAVGSLVVSLIALDRANDANRAQQEMVLRANSASVYGSYRSQDGHLVLAASEAEKDLNAAVLVFPSDFGLEPIQFLLPELSVSFGPLQSALERKLVPRGKKPKRHKVGIPVGILAQSVHRGGTYATGGLYTLLVEVKPSNADIEGKIEFLALARMGNIDMPGFTIYHWPWEELTRPEVDQRIFDRRLLETQAQIDEYWNVVR